MVDEKEFEKIKKEHNKTVMWIEFFSHKMDELEKEIKNLKKDIKERKEKEEILARTVLNLAEDKK
jgi:peptidoglycan hydrolase CwlO-like protein